MTGGFLARRLDAMVPLALTGAGLLAASVGIWLATDGTWGAFAAAMALALGMTLLTQVLAFRAMPEGRAQELGVLWGGLLLACLGTVPLCAALVFFNRSSVPFVGLAAVGASAMLFGHFLVLARLSNFSADLPPAPPAPGWPRLLLGGVVCGGLGVLLAWLGLDPADSEPLSLLAQSQLSACLAGDCAALRAGALSCSEIADVAGQVKRAAHLQSQSNAGGVAVLLLVVCLLFPLALLERRYPRMSSLWSFPFLAGLLLWAGYTAGAGHQTLRADLAESSMSLRAACMSCSGVDGLCDGPWPDVPEWSARFP